MQGFSAHPGRAGLRHQAAGGRGAAGRGLPRRGANALDQRPPHVRDTPRLGLGLGLGLGLALDQRPPHVRDTGLEPRTSRPQTAPAARVRALPWTALD